MVFSSFPIYIDPPSWHQQPNQHLPNGSSNSPLSPLPQSEQPDVRVEPGPIKSSSTLDHAKMPPQEGALKCPRCESTNTKFCYFNNYSLSQPRHFCKTCRRYWTKGGALRNVPVGGGCRRNKKNKRSRSKSPVSTKKPPISSSSTSELIARFQQPFMASLQNMTRYVGNNSLSLREVEAQNMGFQIGGHGSSSDQWWFHQFPNLFNGFESVSCSLLQSESVQGLGVDVAANSSRVTQIPAPVKLEYNNGGLNFSLNNVSENNNLYHSWTDLSAHASSSASHLL